MSYNNNSVNDEIPTDKVYFHEDEFEHTITEEEQAIEDKIEEGDDNEYIIQQMFNEIIDKSKSIKNRTGVCLGEYLTIDTLRDFIYDRIDWDLNT